jgi:uncharacterized protein YhbP (UPF0306 family)
VSDSGEKEARAIAACFLNDISTLTLATASEQGEPWAATVFFAADKNFNLYFVSDHRTQHGRDMAASSRVAATVNPDCDSWHDVRGLQLRGTVDVVEGAERARALLLYFKKFPQIDALFQSPKGDHEETIAARLKAANFYCVRPEMVRVIDNAKGFGYRVEFTP